MASLPGAVLFVLLAVDVTARELSDAEQIAAYGFKYMEGPTRVLLPPLDAGQSLKAAAAAAGIHIGAAINYGGMNGGQGGAIYPNTAISQFDLFTAENECKWQSVSPLVDEYTFAQCDFIMGAGVANTSSQQNRLHNLCWNTENPDWLNKLTDPAALTTALQTHIGNMTRHYVFNSSLACYAIDVVNEAVSDSGSGPLIKNSVPWYPALPTYVEIAFLAAQKDDPSSSALHCYNDYGAEGASSGKAKRVIELIQQIRAAGATVDCVGLQMHISVDSHPDPADVAENIRQLGEMGLVVHITEMDVKCPNCDAQRLQAQAQVYGDMLQACLNNTNCASYETWGIYDGDSWVGADNAPLLWDVNWKPKPAYDQVLSTLQRHAQRKAHK